MKKTIIFYILFFTSVAILAQTDYIWIVDTERYGKRI
jgi:hypothetical protein